MSAPLPTRRDELFRYADLAALAPLWPPQAERIAVEAGGARALSIVIEGDAAIARDLDFVVGDGAELDVRLLSLGRAYGRLQLKAALGKGARFTFGAAQLAGNAQTLEVVTTVIHEQADAVSRQIVRSVAGAGATVNYLGKVLVAKGADGTDGEQSVRAMLLYWTATANAKPELEIHADDVKCAHGCAVGELDAAALFYMAARGLPPEAAKRLMLQAFVAEAFVGAEDEAVLLNQAIAALEAML